MSDVGAVVLTMGESTTARAVASLRAQTLPIAAVAVVDRVTPFHRALNTGVDAVPTAFVLQVDADMVLDRDCAARLRAAMGPEVGIVAGALRDPLMGKIGAIKLYRRVCFDQARPADVLAPEVDFQARLARRGWHTRYLVGIGRQPCGQFGDHRPAYTAAYAYGTYHLLGSRYAAAGDAAALAWRFRALRHSAHATAPVARVAMAAGVLGRETRDVAKPHPRRQDLPFLNGLARRPERDMAVASSLPPLTGARGGVLDAYRDAGASLRAGAPGAVAGALKVLAQEDTPRSLIAEIGLAQGALVGAGRQTTPSIRALLERLSA